MSPWDVDERLSLADYRWCKTIVDTRLKRINTTA